MKRFIFSIYSLWLFFGVALSAPILAQTPYTQRSSDTEIGANDPMAHARLKKTQNWLKSVSAIDIHFRTYTTDAQHLQNDEHAVRGSLLISDNRYRLSLGSQMFYCDGKTLWAYSPQNTEVSIYTYDESSQNMNPIEQIKHYDQYYRAKYIRQENIEGINRHIIDLIPIESSEIMKIRVILNPNDAKIHRIEMYLPQNQVFVYTEMEYNDKIKVSDQDFQFDTTQFPEVMVNDMR